MVEYWTTHLKMEELDNVFEAIEFMCLKSETFEELQHWFRLYETIAQYSYASRSDKQFLQLFLDYYKSVKEETVDDEIIDKFLEKRRRMYDL